MKNAPSQEEFFNWLADIPAQQIIGQRDFWLEFQLTKVCLKNCDYCAKGCGPSMPHSFMQASLPMFYIDQAKKDPLFTREVTYSGGDIFLSYDLTSQEYLPGLLQHADPANNRIVIKTNSHWVNSKHSDKILHDLTDCTIAPVKKDEFGFMRGYLRIDVGVNKHNRNSETDTARMIYKIARSKSNAVFYVTYLNSDEKCQPDSVYKLDEKYELTNAPIIRMINNLRNFGAKIAPANIDGLPALMINDRTVVFVGGKDLYAVCRGAKMSGAIKPGETRLRFKRGLAYPIVFDHVNAGLGGIGDGFINTPIRADNDELKDFSRIKTELTHMATEYEGKVSKNR